MSKRYLVLHHTVGPDPNDNRYHGVITQDGFFHHRRAISESGAACYKFNSPTVNLAVVGNYDILEPTERQIFLIVQVFAAWCRALKLPAEAIVYHGWVGQFAPRSPRYFTACCGKNLIAKLPEIRYQVKKYLL